MAKTEAVLAGALNAYMTAPTDSRSAVRRTSTTNASTAEHEDGGSMRENGGGRSKSKFGRRFRKGIPVRAFGFAARIALFSFIPGVALAEGPLELTSDGCREDDASVERTNDLVAKAGAAYDARDLERAIQLTMQVHEASACVDFLFLLGELHEEAKKGCEARVWYERYASERPNGAHIERARARLAALPSCNAEPPSEPVPAPVVQPAPAPLPTSAPVAPVHPAARPVAPQPYWTVPRVVAWSAIGASAVSAVAAVVYGVRAVNLDTEYVQLWGTPEWEDKNESVFRRGEKAERRALWLGVAAGALAGTGAALLILNRDGKTQSERATLALGVEAGGASGHYRVRF